MSIDSEHIVKIDDLIKLIVENRIKDVHTSIPCIVESFSPDGTVTVSPAIKRISQNDDSESVPTLSNVPVIYPSVGKYRIVFPIEKGNEGMILYSEQEITQFIEKGSISDPIMYRRHNRSDAVFIPSMISNPSRSPIDSSKGLVLEEIGGARIEIGSGQLKLFGTIMFESIPGSGLADTRLSTHVHPTAAVGSPSPPTPGS